MNRIESLRSKSGDSRKHTVHPTCLSGLKHNSTSAEQQFVFLSIKRAKRTAKYKTITRLPFRHTQIRVNGI